MLGHRRREQGAVQVRVHGFDARHLAATQLIALGAVHAREPADVVQVLHARAVRPALQESDGEHAARKDQVAEVVEVVEERRDRPDRRVPVDREHLRGVARVRHPVGTDPSVRPGLRHDPVDDLPVVTHFVLGEFEAPDAEGGPAPARVDKNQRVPCPVPALGFVEVGRAFERDIDQPARPPVARGPDHRGETRARLDPFRKPDIDGDPHVVAHGDVERLVALEGAYRADRPRPARRGVAAGRGECEQSHGEHRRSCGTRWRGCGWIVSSFHEWAPEFRHDVLSGSTSP